MPRHRHPWFSLDATKILFALAAPIFTIYLALLLPGGSDLTPSRLLFRTVSLLFTHMMTTYIDSNIEEEARYWPIDTPGRVYRFWKLLVVIWGIGSLGILEAAGLGQLGETVAPDLEIRPIGVI
jgi:hypothetical protein